MRIAIAAVLYDETTRIGSHRARGFAKGLANLGHDVTVFTHTPSGDALPENSSKDGSIRIVRFPSYSADLWPKSAAPGLLYKALLAVVIAPTVVPLALIRNKKSRGPQSDIDREKEQKIIQVRAASVLKLNQLLSTRLWVKDAKNILSKQSLVDEPFDVVLSTFDPLGRMFKDSGYARTWVNDFRDPAYSPIYLPAIGAYLRYYQNRLLSDADWVTAVSAGVKQALVSSKVGRRYKDKVAMLPNGFTPRTPPPSKPDGIPGPLKVGYTGAIYPQQVNSLRTFLKSLKQESDFPYPPQFHYAGRHSALVRQIATEVGAASILVDHSLISHEESISLQDSMDALLVMSWNTSQEQGILTGKFLEYLGARRPLLALISGDVPGAELSATISATQVGESFEEARGKAEEDRLLHWIKDACVLRSLGHPLPFEPNDVEVDKFSYPHISRKLEKLLRAVSNSPSL